MGGGGRGTGANDIILDAVQTPRIVAAIRGEGDENRERANRLLDMEGEFGNKGQDDIYFVLKEKGRGKLKKTKYERRRKRRREKKK